MKDKICIIDTNIVVAALISADPASPPVRILDAMLNGKLIYMMSIDLLKEYASVLHRPRISNKHGLTDDEIDTILAELVANALWREPAATHHAPDPGDDHLWALLSCQAGSQLVTGDQLLIERPPEKSSIISARRFVELFMTEASK